MDDSYLQEPNLGHSSGSRSPSPSLHNITPFPPGNLPPAPALHHPRSQHRHSGGPYLNANGFNDSRSQLFHGPLHGPRFPSATSLRSQSQSPKHSPTVSFGENNNRSRNSSLLTETDLSQIPTNLRPSRGSALSSDISQSSEFSAPRVSKGKGKAIPSYRGIAFITN